jgi:hypothetical protein
MDKVALLVTGPVDTCALAAAARPRLKIAKNFISVF